MSVEELAAGLTKAQREAVTSSAYIPDADEAWGVKSTRAALIRMGLCQGPPTKGWTFNRLTETGLAVRSYLMAQDGALPAPPLSQE